MELQLIGSTDLSHRQAELCIYTSCSLSNGQVIQAICSRAKGMLLKSTVQTEMLA